MDVIEKHIGKRVKYIRKERGMTQKALSRIIGISMQQIGKYERGENRITVSVLYKIAGALTVQPEAFYFGLPKINPFDKYKNAA